MDEQVSIQLHTVIKDNGQEESNTSYHKGTFYKKDKLEVLSFQENYEDYAIKCLVTIHPDKITIKRSGLIAMNQQFKNQQITETIYKHPHGQMHMETYTESMNHQSLDSNKKGRLRIEYTVKLNGQEARQHALTLTYQKEDE